MLSTLRERVAHDRALAENPVSNGHEPWLVPEPIVEGDDPPGEESPFLSGGALERGQSAIRIANSRLSLGHIRRFNTSLTREIGD